MGPRGTPTRLSRSSIPQEGSRLRSRLRRYLGRKVVLWLVLSACAAFVLYAACGLVQSIDDLDDPPDGDWLCSGHAMECEP